MEKDKRDLIDRLGEPELDHNGKSVLEFRYLKRDKEGNIIETPKELFYRVARNIAEVDRIYNPETDIDAQIREFYGMMAEGYFMPNSPTLMNAGRELQQLAACFVLPIGDDMGTSGKNTGAITDAWKESSLIHKSGGGTGFSFSRIRPKGALVSTTHGLASGPVSYMDVINEATRAINQGGFRRGANLGCLDVYHPDSWQFLFAKEERGKLENFNISLLVDKAFMESVKSNGEFGLIDPKTLYEQGERREVNAEDRYVFSRDNIDRYLDDKPNLYVTKEGELLFFPRCKIKRNKEGKYERDSDGELVFEEKFVIGRVDENQKLRLSSKRFMEYCTRMNWLLGDPGMIFIDRINEDNPTPQVGKIESTNPCGEQPLLPYEACNLGSIALDRFVRDGEIDYGRLERIVHSAVHFLDNVIDASVPPMEEIREIVKANRKIGLGVMGWANMLVKLGIPYDSEEALEKAREVMRFVTERARDASVEIAAKRGVFPNWETSIYDPDSENAREGVKGRRMRNATLTTIAPTGSVSLISGTEASIEPLFGVVFKSLRSGASYYQVNKEFERIGRLEGWIRDENREQLFEKISRNRGSVRGIEEVPERYQRLFRTAHEIALEWHVRMQAAFQEYTDNAVSKTVNLPRSATEEDIKKVFLLAYELGCKGVTIYRDGSKKGQVIQLAEKEFLIPEKVPPVMPAVRIRQLTPFGNMHVSIVINPKEEDDFGQGRALEIFAQLGKGGDVAGADLEAICRLSSNMLRIGGSIKLIIEQLTGIGSNITQPAREGSITSLGDALAKVLTKYVIAKQRYPLNDLLTGKVDYDELYKEASDIIRKARTSQEIFNGLSIKGKERVEGRRDETEIYMVKCDCGGVMKFESGCWVCVSCGYSRCS